MAYAIRARGERRSLAFGWTPVGRPWPCGRPSAGRRDEREKIMSIETWTAERIEQLRNFASSGLSSSQIAAEIGVTRNAVIGKLNRLGLARGWPAGGSARSCPPRASRPRHSPQRTLLRLMFAQAP